MTQPTNPDIAAQLLADIRDITATQGATSPRLAEALAARGWAKTAASARFEGAPDLPGSDHPYYAEEGSYYERGMHNKYASWSAFLDAEGDSDLDLNLLYRWDWEVPNPTRFLPGEELPGETVALFFVHQRKAQTRSARVEVTRADEPAVREYLAVRADRLRMVWAPMLDTAEQTEPAEAIATAAVLGPQQPTPVGYDAVMRAAREHVERQHPAWHGQGVGIVQRSHYRVGFVDGAVWQHRQANEAAHAQDEEADRG